MGLVHCALFYTVLRLYAHLSSLKPSIYNASRHFITNIFTSNHQHFLKSPIPFLSIYLGHDGINETSKYLKFSNEMFPESIDAFGDFMSGLLPEVGYEK